MLFKEWTLQQMFKNSYSRVPLPLLDLLDLVKCIQALHTKPLTRQHVSLPRCAQWLLCHACYATYTYQRLLLLPRLRERPKNFPHSPKHASASTFVMYNTADIADTVELSVATGRSLSSKCLKEKGRERVRAFQCRRDVLRGGAVDARRCILNSLSSILKIVLLPSFPFGQVLTFRISYKSSGPKKESATPPADHFLCSRSASTYRDYSDNILHRQTFWNAF